MVMEALIRKAGHVLDDPVLRRWMIRRVVGLEKSPPAFLEGQPPYLGGRASEELGADPVPDDFQEGVFAPPGGPISIELPGQAVELDPENPQALFDIPYADLETLLAAHRFAWLPVAGPAVDVDWVSALWRIWVERFGEASSGWPWHAYTAAERAINIIDFSRRFGWPDDPDKTASLLMRHAEVILGNLEYSGDHYTSNHLSNNGRGLLRIGTALGMPDVAEIGAQIMVAEAGRIFGRSGVLREGSTHYHLLVTRNYIDAWLDARAADLDQTGMLHEIAERALAVIPRLVLPGGMPLIGDISPDVPPSYLAALTGDVSRDRWPVNLPEDRQQEALKLVDGNIAVSPDKLAEDGWHLFGGHNWQALAFVSPDGWPPMPGHGHQDLGSFELHDGTTPVVIDPGRGSYAAAEYENATVHSGIIIDETGSMPVNRAYYSSEFRDRILPRRPEIKRMRDGQILDYDGSGHGARISNVERAWSFSEGAVEICDRVQGRGKHRIRQQFIVPGSVRISENCAVISIGAQEYKILASVPPESAGCMAWKSYGCGDSACILTFDQTVRLPFEGKVRIEQN